MSLIDRTYFIGELNIPGTDKTEVQERLDWFIAKYESELLLNIMGYRLYTDFAAGIAVLSPEQKWLDLKNGVQYTNKSNKPDNWKGMVIATPKQSFIANYVYFFWMKDHASYTSTTGEVRNKPENAMNVWHGEKMVRAWNEMSSWVDQLIAYLNVKRDDYTGWTDQNSYDVQRVYRPINIFGI